MFLLCDITSENRRKLLSKYDSQVKALRTLFLERHEDSCIHKSLVYQLDSNRKEWAYCGRFPYKGDLQSFRYVFNSSVWTVRSFMSFWAINKLETFHFLVGPDPNTTLSSLVLVATHFWWTGRICSFLVIFLLRFTQSAFVCFLKGELTIFLGWNDPRIY